MDLGLLTVVSDKITRAFKALRIYSRAFDRVWHAGFFTNLSFMGFQVIYLSFLSFLSNRWLQALVGAKYSQKYSVNFGVP